MRTTEEGPAQFSSLHELSHSQSSGDYERIVEDLYCRASGSPASSMEVGQELILARMLHGEHKPPPHRSLTPPANRPSQPNRVTIF